MLITACLHKEKKKIKAIAGREQLIMTIRVYYMIKERS
jgi:hypothetical protein